jgi:hypothetical protein
VLLVFETGGVGVAAFGGETAVLVVGVVEAGRRLEYGD